LEKALNTNKDALNGATFQMINSKEIRSAEADRTVHVKDIPLYAKSETIKNYFSKHGKIDRFSMTTAGPWQQAYVVYEKGTRLERLHTNTWSVNIMDFSVRIYPVTLAKEIREEREAYCLKLSGLPRGTTHLDLKDLLEETNAKACFIPRSRTTYKNLNYAFIYYDSDDAALKAFEKSFKLRNDRLFWTAPGYPHCYICGDPNHKTNKCTNKKSADPARQQFNNLYQRFKPAQYRARAPPTREQFINNQTQQYTRLPNQRDHQSHQRYMNNKQQSRSYAETAAFNTYQNNTSMHERNRCPPQQKETTNNNSTPTQPGQKEILHPGSGPSKVNPNTIEERFCKIFHNLDLIRKEIQDIKAQTKLIQDELTIVKGVQSEHEQRINNLEYKNDSARHEQELGQMGNFSQFNPDPQNQDQGYGHPGNGYYSEPRHVKRQRNNEFIDEDDESYLPAEVHIMQLQERNEKVENRLEEVMQLLQQIQGTVVPPSV
jgi:hypothetical protein